jgi:putative DNA primase/helicase
LTRPEELSGILNCGLRGLHRLFENGGFTEPPKVRAVLEDYKSCNDTVRAFLTECADADPGESVSKKEFYSSYKRWCKQNGCYPKSQKNLKTTVLTFSPEIREGRPRGVRSWMGLRLNEEAPKDGWEEV